MVPEKPVCMPVYEFLLWNNCNNSCTFCHQKANRAKYPGKFPDDQGKANSIDLVTDYINKPGLIPQGSHLLLMGGELFDTQLPPNVERKFKSLAYLVLFKMMQGSIDLLYVNTNLIYVDTSLLQWFLDLFTSQGMTKRIRFTTSYDVAYRFSTGEYCSLMLENLAFIRDEYKELRIVANMVLTDEACDFLKMNPMAIKTFSDNYGIEINLMPYITLHKYISPKRSTVLKLLTLLDAKHPGYLEGYVANVSLDQKKIIFEYDGEKLAYASSSNSECNHNENFRKVYSDSDKCFICDCIELKKTLYS